jgi:hypothetical protein
MWESSEVLAAYRGQTATCPVLVVLVDESLDVRIVTRALRGALGFEFIFGAIGWHGI